MPNHHRYQSLDVRVKIATACVLQNHAIQVLPPPVAGASCTVQPFTERFPGKRLPGRYFTMHPRVCSILIFNLI